MILVFLKINDVLDIRPASVCMAAETFMLFGATLVSKLNIDGAFMRVGVRRLYKPGFARRIARVDKMQQMTTLPLYRIAGRSPGKKVSNLDITLQSNSPKFFPSLQSSSKLLVDYLYTQNKRLSLTETFMLFAATCLN